MLKSRIMVALLLVAVMAVPVYANEEDALPLAKAEAVGMSSERLQRIETYIQEYVDTNQIAGAVTLVARKGKVVRYEALCEHLDGLGPPGQIAVAAAEPDERILSFRSDLHHRLRNL